MPRPTAAQLAYGSATVICSTLVMLLLSGTTTGIGVAVIAIAALGLGLLVALTVTAPGRSRTVGVARSRRTAAPGEAPEVQVPGQRVRTGGEARVRQHSLRR
ncbi:hypothetical protein [Streptomyces sp. NPDC088400]|jgi:hypothetical protein|uniref:hypothetical protein n=1 Tax=Streptomyces sp. NPDC088400 TaxID=3365861 RepID=UPI0038162031